MLRGARVTTGFFRLLGIRMARGRDFSAEDDASPGRAVAIVSDRLVRSAGGEKALGETITVNGISYLVVGTLPRAFHFGLLQDADIFVPLVPDAERAADWSDRSIRVVGRLNDEIPLQRARAELDALMAELAREHPEDMAGRTVTALSLRDALLGNTKVILAGLLGAVVLLLVIMCANLALLMLTHYVERTPELATRSALGATRARVMRQLLVERLLPSLVGAALAMVVGQMVTWRLLAAIPDGLRINMPYLDDGGIDTRVVSVIIAVAIVLAAGFGLGPALFIARRNIGAIDRRTTPTRGDRRLRRGLVAAQLALTVVLLVASGLLVASFRNLMRRDVGFRNPETLVTARAPLSGPRYQDASAQRQFYDALVTRTAALPGVRSAGLIDEVPGNGGGFTTFAAADHPAPRSRQARAVLRIVGGEYFRTMGIPLVAGRAFESHDNDGTPPVVVVSASLARLLARDGATLGRRVRFADTDTTPWEVIGVVGDVQVTALDTDSPPTIYLSHLQRAENRLMLVVRTARSGASVASQIRPIVKNLDSGVPLYAVATLDQLMSQSRAVFSREFPLILCGVFAAFALALTLVALYAMCLHDVVARRREFGIRLALGGAPNTIRRLILREGLLSSGGGVAAGIMIAILVTRAMQSILYGVTATDWRVYVIVIVATFASALLATLGPVLRAGAVNPAVALRAK
jgi:putative ABC transport system permease protein